MRKRGFDFALTQNEMESRDLITKINIPRQNNGGIYLLYPYEKKTIKAKEWGMVDTGLSVMLQKNEIMIVHAFPVFDKNNKIVASQRVFALSDFTLPLEIGIYNESDKDLVIDEKRCVGYSFFLKTLNETDE